MSITDSPPNPGLPTPKIDLRTPRSSADQIFRIALIACASTVLVVLAGIVLFLLARSGQAWSRFHFGLFTTVWRYPTKFGFKGAIAGSVVIAIVALAVALPISIVTALAINEFVPRRARGVLIGLIDLLAALPSLIYGLWGRLFLTDHLHLTTIWLGHHAAFFPPFRLSGTLVDHSLFDAGIVVGIMVIPLMTAISREVMSQVPRETCEAALALGGTRWGMITDVILPFARSGIIGGAMLGLGRALGETIAVSLVISPSEVVKTHILQPGGDSVSALIVNNFPGAGALEKSALTAAGLTLFAITLAINVGARTIVSRASQ